MSMFWILIALMWACCAYGQEKGNSVISNPATLPSSTKPETTIKPPTEEQAAKVFPFDDVRITRDSQGGNYGFGKIIWQRDYSVSNEFNSGVSIILLEGGTHLTAEQKKSMTDRAAKGGRYAPSIVTLQGNRSGYIQDNFGSFSSPDGKYDVMVVLRQLPPKGMQGGKIKVTSLGLFSTNNAPRLVLPATILEPALQKLDAIFFPPAAEPKPESHPRSAVSREPGEEPGSHPRKQQSDR